MADQEQKPAVLHVTDFSVFHTAKRAEEGRRLILTAPEGGETDAWIDIRGIDSPTYKQLQVPIIRALNALDDVTTPEAKAEAARLNRKLVAAFVIDWSNPQPCTEDAVIKLFEEAPQIESLVDRSGARRALFFALPPRNSSNTPATSSG